MPAFEAQYAGIQALATRPSIEEIPTNELYGFPTAPDNPLADAVNEAIGQLIEDGTMDELYQKYFSTDAPESVTEG